ncbi:ATP-binding protein [Nocardiopsis exhalans]|uniref:ATP-binding protein n=1 Tax=Nocardiopsis exhalans TaxID=163604 RepID=A0ABY5DF88_9ACTN|nr:ATP-binding protein [Nocardiopsis exhalans]USY21762.1 ATP-binding protein [Nocardiopsis exhalans]
MLTETHHRDGKQDLREKKDMAKDMASFAIDGGLLVIGLREDKEAGRFFLAPIERQDQVEETPERIALTRCDPPLLVRTQWIDSHKKTGQGYLLVEIPASSLAPHMVDGRYYGRGEKQKYPLSDAQVQRLMASRDISLSRIREELQQVVTEDRWPEGENPHLHVVARPVSGQRRQFLEVTNGQFR